MVLDAVEVADESTAGLTSEQLADYTALCRGGVAAAATRGRPVMVSWTVPTPHLDVADRTAHISPADGRTFVWSSAWTGLRRLAVGTALDLTGHRSVRFEQVSESWRQCRAGALLGGSGREPAVVGGFRFDERDASGSSLPDALMWLPTAELTQTRDSVPELTLNAWIHPAGSADDAVTAALDAVRRLASDDPTAADQPRPRLLSLQETPSRRDWLQLVRRALAAIDHGTFSKVVLARQISATYKRPIAVAPVLAALLDQHSVGAVFGAQLGGSWFIGRTPECLLRLDGERVQTHGLAGSLPRDPDPVRDRQLRENLLSDPKLEREHTIVADYIMATLREHFRDVHTTVANPVLKLADIQHLQTGISAGDPLSRPDPLRLAGALHPTPALGGYPCARALRWLHDNEPFDRDWYAAPIGWIDSDGGELAVGIRSALINATTATVYAGCGIVRGSDPEDEYRETCVKMRQMLAVLGIDDHEMAA